MSTKTKKLLSAVMIVVLLGAGFVLSQRTNGIRTEQGLARMELPAQARPDLLTNVLLSVGRALAVDYLWIGLQNMQQEGRYFDAMQRAEWICHLQPHFPAVWIFHSWNLSYNISVAMNSEEDRWRWVLNGIEILRDRGIALNPQTVKLYQQLAWIYHHKVGGLSDDCHWYYKSQLALAIEDIVGWPEEQYALMARSPRTWEALMARPGMAGILAQFEGFGLDARKDLFALLAKPQEYGEKVQAFLADPANQEDLQMLEGHLRRDRLYKEWKLDAEKIAKLRTDDMFGPLDFRTPQAHAIYWSYLGQEMSGDDASFEALSADRVVYGSLQDLVRRGRIHVSKESPLPLISPDVRFIPVVHHWYVAFGKKWAQINEEEWDGTAGETFRSGHVNFLRKGITLYYQYGRMDKAREYWDTMTEMYPLPEYGVGMEAYVHKLILEDLLSPGLPDVNASVQFFLMDAYRRYALGDDYSAMGMERLAKTLYDSYQDERSWSGEMAAKRVAMPSWPEMVRKTREQAYAALPPELSQRLRERLGDAAGGDSKAEPSPVNP